MARFRALDGGGGGGLQNVICRFSEMPMSHVTLVGISMLILKRFHIVCNI